MTDVSAATPKDGTELVRAFLPSSPFVAQLGLRLSSIADGEAELELPYRPELATVGDMVHGGAIAAAIDVAAMAAAWAGAPLPEKLRGATVSLSVDFVDAALGEDLHVRGTLVRRGRSLASCEVTVCAGTERRTVAKALVTYKMG